MEVVEAWTSVKESQNSADVNENVLPPVAAGSTQRKVQNANVTLYKVVEEAYREKLEEAVKKVKQE